MSKNLFTKKTPKSCWLKIMWMNTIKKINNTFYANCYRTHRRTLFNLYEIHINDTNTRPRNYKNKIVDQHSLWWHMQTSLTICYQSSMITVVVFVQSLNCVQLCDPIDCSMPGFPVLYLLLELTQTHVHWVNDTIQPPHPP